MPPKKKTIVMTGKFDTGRQAREIARETIGTVKATQTVESKLRKKPKHIKKADTEQES